jgi:hypothetical protein
MYGEVAENYGALIEKLWSGTTASVAPRDFKVSNELIKSSAERGTGIIH